MQQQKEKMRVYALAKMLDMESKDLLDVCQQVGIDVKNQLSSLDHDQCELVRQRLKGGSGGGVAVATAPKAAAPLVAPHQKVRQLDSRPKPAGRPLAPPGPAAELTPEIAEPSVAPESPAAAEWAPAAVAPPAAAEEPAPVEALAPAEEPAPVEAPAPAPAVTLRPTPPSVPVAPPAEPSVAPPATPPVQPVAAELPTRPATPSTPPAQPRPATLAAATPPGVPPAPAPTPRTPAPSVLAPRPPAPLKPQAPAVPPAAAGPTAPPSLPGVGPQRMPTLSQPGRPRDLSQPRPEGGPGGPGGPARPRRERPTLRPFVLTARPPTPLKPIKPAEDKKQPAQPPVQKPIAQVPKDLTAGKGPINIKEILNRPPVAPAVPTAEDEDDESKKKSPGGVAGREERHKERAKRALERKGREQEKSRNLLGDDEEGRRRGGLGGLKKKLRRQPGTLPPKSDKVVMQGPLTVRALSEAIGIRSAELIFKLRDVNQGLVSINTTLDPDVAVMIALEYGRELEVRKVATSEDELASLHEEDKPEDLQPRAPIVTIMGHVDHGKTSLLDKIRKSNVVATEAGGITQVIRAWRVEHNGHPVTFLDTPGHEAFTKMRARGANVTDIAVIVVAADDGVMPQTEEAINHAKAAGVSLVVAINKTDMPNANIPKTRQQLYGLSVLPDNMGGDVPFVETSAATGKGIDELLETLAVVAELKELKANPNRRAEGTCLEAMLNEGEGVLATLLVRNGTLRRGDILVCGATYGRVRAMYDDLGRPLGEAGPSVPVRIAGLDEVPNADDAFQVVPDLAMARDIAEKRRGRQQSESQGARRGPLSLDNLAEVKIVELKVILKADFRGSVEAIRKELEKLRHEEVCVRILEAGIGAITENDVWLALASPQDTMIVGFNVVPDDRALRLAEERGVPIREYDIIYKLTEDVRAALEGKLKPREEVIHLGRAVVRETFKISRVGTIAGCYVTQGTIERTAKVRVIREGVVVYPPSDRTASLESLKRFKDDVREVRESFECGIKVAGYDDVKVGDVVEAYRVEQVQRTLDK